MTGRARIENKWPSRGKFDPVVSDVPAVLLDLRGIVLAPVVPPGHVDSETTLLLIQDPSVCREFEGQHITGLFLRPGAASTSWGPIFYLHFQIPDPATHGQTRLTFEYLVNTLSPEDVELVGRLSIQSHWHLFLIDPSGAQRSCFEFENTFLLGEAIARTNDLLRSVPLRDFMKAKEEFFQRYTMEELLSAQPG